MTQSQSRLDRVAQLAFIGACIALMALAVSRFGGGAVASTSPGARSGSFTGFSFPNTSPVFDAERRTVLLVVSSRCRFCIDSAPFYARIERAARGRSTKVAFAGPEPREILQTFLRTHGVAAPLVVAMPAEIHVPVTPTLLVIDAGGKVVRSWLGRLSEEQERELLSLLS